MTRLGTAALLLVAGCGGCRDGDPASLPPPPPPLELATAHYEGFLLPVPSDWIEDRTDLQPRGLQYRGPREDGFMPVVIFYPRVTAGTDLDAFARRQRQNVTHAANPAEILIDVERLRIGGMEARRLVYTRRARDRERNRDIDVRTMDWYFRGPRGIGMLRTVCISTAFLRRRPLFERIASGLRPASGR